MSASEPEIVAARTVSGSFRFARRALAGCEIAEEVDPAPPHRPSLRSQAVRGLWISGPAARGPGYRGRMFARLIPSALAAAVLCAIVSGCSAPAEPAEPSPLFTSEEQAFAAAEETYRAYVDALNAVDLSDPESFEDVFAWTTGEANAGARETFSQMHADGWTVSGSTVPTVVANEQVELASEPLVLLAVCTDVSSVDVIDREGVSVVAADRGDTQSMTVGLVAAETSTGLAVSSLTGRTGDPTCD